MKKTEAWLGSWKNRMSITINNAVVADTLVNFPIRLSSKSNIPTENFVDFFAELSDSSSRKKIAATTDDGITECYVEIGKSDFANFDMLLWVKVPIINRDKDTTIYLYFDVNQVDNPFVSDIDEKPIDTAFLRELCIKILLAL